MKIDLSSLYSGIDEYIEIDELLDIDPNYYENTDIINLSKLKVNGTISLDASNNIECNFKVKGSMILNDAISLDEVTYPFECEFIENLEDFDKNFENTLDIIPILWENIVLEVPLKFTKVKDLSKFSGDGWKIISEEELKHKNNPFNDLDLGEEWYKWWY